MAKLRVDKIAAPIVKDEYTGSVHFDGTGDYLSVTDNGDFDASGDFNIEFWANLSLTDSNAWLVSKYDSANNRREYIVTVNSSGKVSFYWSTDGSTHGALSTSDGTITAYTWNHYAWVKKGSVLTGYINGVALVQKTDLTSQYNNSVTPLYVGSLDGSQSFTGYISNLRICKGHAVYDGNFTVPTRELEVHTGAKGVVFPAADNRTVLLACQDAYNPLTEATGRHKITGAGNLGGVPGQELVENGDFASSLDNWTASGVQFSHTTNNVGGNTSGKLMYYATGTNTSRNIYQDVPTVSGARYVLSFDSSSDTASANTIDIAGTTVYTLEDNNNANLIRTEIGFTASSSTTRIRFISTVSNRAYLDNVSVVAVTPNNEANPGLLRKTNITSTITETTGSVYFDGGDDGLRSTPYDELTLGTGAFTIECWFWRQNITDTWQVLVADNLYQSAGGWSLYTNTDDIRFYKGGAQIFIVSNCYSAQTWTHIAVQRDSGGRWSCYINGIDQGVSATDGVDFTDNRICIGTSNYNSNYPNEYNYKGYISNVRICKGHTVYKSNFTPPTTELEVHPETVLLACYDGENVFAEKTGKIIAANGGRTSSPTPTATDRPIGITTFQPELTREVDPVEGPTFVGGAGFVSQNWLTLPKGTTTERFPDFGAVDAASARGLFGGGRTPSYLNTIDYVTISTTGNAQDFGDLTQARGYMASSSSRTRGVFNGGGVPGAVNTQDFITISSTGDASNFGDLQTARYGIGNCSSSIRGVFGGGNNPSVSNVIEFITIATAGNTQDFGDLTQARVYVSGCSSNTRGVFGGGTTPSDKVDTMDFITISSTGNATDFGNLTQGRTGVSGLSSRTRGVFSGGLSGNDPYTYHNIIDYITIATLGDAADFGDLIEGAYYTSSCSSSTRGVIGGAFVTPAYKNTIQYVTIASTGDAQDFGDLTATRGVASAVSNGHGGLG